jgi:hypothetical protein
VEEDGEEGLGMPEPLSTSFSLSDSDTPSNPSTSSTDLATVIAQLQSTLRPGVEATLGSRLLNALRSVCYEPRYERGGNGNMGACVCVCVCVCVCMCVYVSDW